MTMNSACLQSWMHGGTRVSLACLRPSGVASGQCGSKRSAVMPAGQSRKTTHENHLIQTDAHSFLALPGLRASGAALPVVPACGPQVIHKGLLARTITRLQMRGHDHESIYLPPGLAGPLRGRCPRHRRGYTAPASDCPLLACILSHMSHLRDAQRLIPFFRAACNFFRFTFQWIKV